MQYREQPFHEYQFAFSRHIPRAVKWIIIVNVVLYFVEHMVFAFGPLGAGDRFLNWVGLAPDRVFIGGRIWQLVTYAFFHDPSSLFHLIFNMLFLYWFGREVEMIWGTRRFLWFYFAAAVFSGLLFALLEVIIGRPALCIGASGAIMAVVMVYALWFPNRLILLMLIFPIRIWTFVLITIGIETLHLLSMARRSEGGGVAHMAHLGGLLFGFLVVKAGPYLAYLFRSSRRAHYVEIDDSERRLDEILDKVHHAGIHSLSWRERRFLKKMSRRRR